MDDSKTPPNIDAQITKGSNADAQITKGSHADTQNIKFENILRCIIYHDSVLPCTALINAYDMCKEIEKESINKK